MCWAARESTTSCTAACCETHREEHHGRLVTLGGSHTLLTHQRSQKSPSADGDGDWQLAPGHVRQYENWSGQSAEAHSGCQLPSKRQGTAQRVLLCMHVTRTRQTFQEYSHVSPPMWAPTEGGDTQGGAQYLCMYTHTFRQTNKHTHMSLIT